MTGRKRLIAFAVILTLVLIVVYGCNFTYLVESFFSVPLSHPEAPINKLCGKIYDPMRCIFVRASIALDAKGCIYILGRKKDKAQILVLNRQGKVERVITPRLKGGRLLRGSLFSVSPSGNYLWTVEWEGKVGVHRVTLHDRNGRAKMDWLISSEVTSHLLLNSYSEYGAYLVSGVSKIFHFDVRQKKFQQLKGIEIPPMFFHDGRYWGITELKWLIPQIDNLKFEKHVKKSTIKEDLLGIVTWSPYKGMRLISIIRLLERKGSIKTLQWIDEKGNFYIYNRGLVWLDDFLPFGAKEGIIAKTLNTLKLSYYPLFKYSKAIMIFSQSGELLDVIPVSRVIRPARGEKLEYGQLVKVDEKGIYWEVEKVNEPREYRIVRIVKKKRWQVWWEKLTSWWTKH